MTCGDNFVMTSAITFTTILATTFVAILAMVLSNRSCSPKQRGMEGEYHAAINSMGRAATGALRTTPLGIVAAESALTPARDHLDY